MYYSAARPPARMLQVYDDTPSQHPTILRQSPASMVASRPVYTMAPPQAPLHYPQDPLMWPPHPYPVAPMEPRPMGYSRFPPIYPPYPPYPMYGWPPPPPPPPPPPQPYNYWNGYRRPQSYRWRYFEEEETDDEDDEEDDRKNKQQKKTSEPKETKETSPRRHVVRDRGGNPDDDRYYLDKYLEGRYYDDRQRFDRVNGRQWNRYY